MRIIEIGKIGESIAQCANCYAQIGYFPIDVRYKRIRTVEYKYFLCPVCGKPIILQRWEDE